VLEMGIMVALGLIFMFMKMSWRWKMRLLSNPLAVDVFVFVCLNLLHWGSFSGVMVAAIGAMFCSLTLSVGRWWFGYVSNGRYTQGWVNVESKL
jgi:hypothetical protein